MPVRRLSIQKPIHKNHCRHDCRVSNQPHLGRSRDEPPAGGRRQDEPRCRDHRRDSEHGAPQVCGRRPTYLAASQVRPGRRHAAGRTTFTEKCHKRTWRQAELPVCPVPRWIGGQAPRDGQCRQEHAAGPEQDHADHHGKTPAVSQRSAGRTIAIRRLRGKRNRFRSRNEGLGGLADWVGHHHPIIRNSGIPAKRSSSIASRQSLTSFS